MMIRLKIKCGPHKGEDFEFKEGEVIYIGRSRRNRVCLRNDPYISKEHGKIEFWQGRFIYSNLSKFGSIIKRKGEIILSDERIIQEEFLENGDEITLGKGDTLLEIELLEEPKEIPFEDESELGRTIFAYRSQEEIERLIERSYEYRRMILFTHKLLKDIQYIYDLDTLLKKACGLMIKIFEQATLVIILLKDKKTEQVTKRVWEKREEKRGKEGKRRRDKD